MLRVPCELYDAVEEDTTRREWGAAGAADSDRLAVRPSRDCLPESDTDDSLYASPKAFLVRSVEDEKIEEATRKDGPRPDELGNRYIRQSPVASQTSCSCVESQ